MRGIIFFLCLLLSSVAFSQTKYYIRADSIIFQRLPTGSEFILENDTKDSLGALVNIGNGRTAFRKARISGDTLFIGRDTVLGVGGSGGTDNANAGSAYRLLIPGTQQIKTLQIDNGLTPDSATSGQIGIKWGGALTANTTISGSNVRDVTFSGLDDYTMTLDRNYFITNTKSDVVAKFEFHGPESGNVISLLQQTTSGDSAAYLNANEYSIGISARQTNPVNEASLIDVFPTYINFQQNGAEGGEYRFHNMQTRYDTTGGWLPLMWRHNDTTIAKLNFWPGGGLSGSGTSDQVAVWNGASSLTGTSFLTTPSGVSLQITGTSTGGTDTYLNVKDGANQVFSVSDIDANGVWSSNINQPSGSNGPYHNLKVAGVNKISVGVSSGDAYVYTQNGANLFMGGDGSNPSNNSFGRSANETNILNAPTRAEYTFLLKEMAAPSAPAANYVSIYVKSDGLVYGKDDAGVETKLSNAASGIDDVLAVGQVLTTNRTIDASTFELSVSGAATTPNNTFEVTNSSSGTALQVTGTSGTGINISNSSGTGIISTSTTGLAGLFVVNPASTNTVVAAMTPRRQTSGSPSAGIGVSIPMEVEGTGSTIAAVTLEAVLTNVGAGTQHSQFRVNAYNAGTPATVFTIDGNGAIILTGRLQTDKGIDVASANDLTLGADGNVFVITGTTTINAITTANWQAGSEITLVFTGATTVKHNTAGGGGTARMFLAGSVDLSTAIHTTLTLVYDGTQWQEKSRKIP